MRSQPRPPPAPHLPSLLVNHVEDGVAFGVPEKAVADALPSQLARHHLKQVHLDWLLHEHHIVLSHGCKSSRGFSKTWGVKPGNALMAGVPTEAVVVGWFGFIGRWNRAQNRGSLQGLFLRLLGGWNPDDVVVRAWTQEQAVNRQQVRRGVGIFRVIFRIFRSTFGGVGVPHVVRRPVRFSVRVSGCSIHSDELAPVHLDEHTSCQHRTREANGNLHLRATPLASAYLLGGFQLLRVKFVYDCGLGADIIIAFVGHKADIGVVCGLWRTSKPSKQNR